ncbi:MAG TPA: hemolysin III family protein [Spirochaetia bacterium]|nr:hemolysin III family protein [Spirochaetales bacterium]HRW24706.1 hemolysin III family protein [Spirochaetia bacterium]
MSDRAYSAPAASPARYPLGEEIANAITHGVWALLSVAGLVVLIVSAATRGDAWHVVSFTIFGASAVVLFTMSTIYHAVAAPRAKKVLRVIDHSSVYLLIAGTYTPFALTALRPTIGWVVFGVIWGAAALGIALKPFLTGKMKFVSTAAYVLMGWIIVFAWKPLAAAVDASVLRYLVAGGVAYTVGAAFYLLKRRCWTHPAWHLFVGAGATLHFFAVLALLPQG